MASYHRPKEYTLRLYERNTDKSVTVYKLSVPTETLKNFRSNQMTLIKEDERVYCSNAVGITSRVFVSEYDDMIIPGEKIDKLKKENKHEFIPLNIYFNGKQHGSIANYIVGNSVNNPTAIIQYKPVGNGKYNFKYFILPQKNYDERNSMIGIVQVTRLAYIMQLIQKGCLEDIDLYIRPTEEELKQIINMFTLREKNIIPAKNIVNLPPDSYIKGSNLTVRQLNKRIKSDTPFIKQLIMKK